MFVGALTMFTGDIQATDWQANLRVGDTTVTFKLDTGAQADVLHVLRMHVSHRIKPRRPLDKTGTVLRAFGDVKITPVSVV